MNREDAKQEIKNQWRNLITFITEPAKLKVNGETSYICPLCGHGAHGDGISYNPNSKDKNTLHCFGCDFDGDIIDLYMKSNNADFKTALDVLAEWLYITIDEPQRKEPPLTELPKEYTAYYKQCRERLTDAAAVDYLSRRGISVETAKAAGLGYDPQSDPSGKGYPAPRLIIPTSITHYTARSIDPNTPAQYQKLNPKGSSPGIFNGGILSTVEPETVVFITEGAFDALSLMEIGFNAIAINSTSNAEKLIRTLTTNKTDATFVICMDNDNAGNKAVETLRKGLQRLNIPHITADICGGANDPNEALTSNRDAFTTAAQKAVRQAAAKPDNVTAYIDNLMADELKAFKNDIKTGFSNLDEQCGGLYPGLYVIAAISSLGKTTFAHQMADQIAAAGHDVLFFSLEQSRLEMVTKSLARLTAKKDLFAAVTARQIQNRETLTPEIAAAADEYKRTVADRLSIIEGNFNCDISYIGNYLRRYISRNNVTPVVIVDYLQILQPAFEGMKRQTIKEAIDSTVTELKRISREHGTPVIVVSSVNRANYLTPIDFESLKESGNIEYTADVIWGLQLSVLNSDTIFEKEGKIKQKRETVRDAKTKQPREIDLICLKNRYGLSSYVCTFDYYPKNDMFKPSIREKSIRERILEKQKRANENTVIIGGETTADNSWENTFRGKAEPEKKDPNHPKPKQGELEYIPVDKLSNGQTIYEIRPKGQDNPADEKPFTKYPF